MGAREDRRASVRNPARRAAAAIVPLLALLLAGCSRPGLETGRLGKVQVREAAGPARALVFLFSGAKGWGGVEENAAASLSSLGSIVVGVDLPSYRKALDASDGECLYLLSEIEALSQQIQREYGVTAYLSPILAGIGEGGALAAATLAQSPAATVAGAVVVDPGASLATRLPLCAGAAAHRGERGFVYDTTGSLPGFLSFGFSAAADAEGRARVLGFPRTDGAGHIDLDEFGADPATATRPANRILVELVTAHLSPAGAGSGRELPDSVATSLVEMRAAAASDALVIVISGDGGWRDLDKTIAGYVQDHGVHVVGWDSLRYFWHEKSPERFAADLDAVIRRYTKAWGASDVVLVGFSFGADVMPFGYNRLPADTRRLVREVSLLSLSKTADFEFHVAGLLGAGDSPSGLPTAPELAQLPPRLVQCFYGEEEDETACPELAAGGVEVIRTRGDHHFDGDYDALARKILAGLVERRRSDSTTSSD